MIWAAAATVAAGYLWLGWLIWHDERTHRWEPPPGDGSYDDELRAWLSGEQT